MCVCENGKQNHSMTGWWSRVWSDQRCFVGIRLILRVSADPRGQRQTTRTVGICGENWKRATLQPLCAEALKRNWWMSQLLLLYWKVCPQRFLPEQRGVKLRGLASTSEVCEIPYRNFSGFWRDLEEDLTPVWWFLLSGEHGTEMWAVTSREMTPAVELNVI